jgi:hypothetical protein
MRGRFQDFPPKRKEVAQPAPDLQMFMGQGQVERDGDKGETSGLGTLSPGPPPLPASLLLLAFPPPGGRAFGFSHGLARLGGLLPLGVRRLFEIPLLLGARGAEG